MIKDPQWKVRTIFSTTELHIAWKSSMVSSEIREEEDVPHVLSMKKLEDVRKKLDEYWILFALPCTKDNLQVIWKEKMVTKIEQF